MAVTDISKCKFLNNRLLKWSIFLEQFNYEIRHITGKENKISVYLSWIKLEEQEIEPINRPIIMAFKYKFDTEIVKLVKNIKVLQQEDPFC